MQNSHIDGLPEESARRETAGEEHAAGHKPEPVFRRGKGLAREKALSLS